MLQKGTVHSGALLFVQSARDAATETGSPMRIDLNADVGESSAPIRSATTPALMRVDHVGQHRRRLSRRRSVRPARRRFGSAKAHGVAVGAHPGFPDLVGIRPARACTSAPREAEDFVLYQIAAVAGVAAAEGVRASARQAARRALQHGGARRACWRPPSPARSRRSIRGSILFGPPGSELLRAGRAAGLRVAAEGFADRAYEPDGIAGRRRTETRRGDSSMSRRSSAARFEWRPSGR